MAILDGIKFKGEDTVHQIDYEKGIGNKPKLIKSFNDLEDKPFYAEQETVEVLPLQDLTFVIEDGGGMYIPETPIGLKEGKTYKVHWDNDDYECVCTRFDNHEQGFYVIYIGNSVFAGLEDSGEPFILLEMFMENGQLFQHGLTTGDLTPTHKVSIQIQDEIIHQLDSKYVDAFTKEETKNLIASAITTALNTEV